MTFTVKNTLALVLLSTASFATLAQTPLKGCAAKEANIQQQLDYAKAHNNSGRIAGLEKALSEVRANCTDASLQAQREENVREKEQKVAERQQELKEAQASEHSDKIEKRVRKLQEALSELTEAKAALQR